MEFVFLSPEVQAQGSGKISAVETMSPDEHVLFFSVFTGMHMNQLHVVT